MSDVSIARAGWIGAIVMGAVAVIALTVGCLPKITTRRRWSELREKESAYDLAIERIAENQQMRAALMHVRDIIKDGAMTGFNCHDGDWADRLFASQGLTHPLVRGHQQSAGNPDA